MADPTVTDVFNQLVLVNGKLDQVEVNTAAISNVNMSINKGFAATVNALQAIALINIEAVKLLFHQTQQGDAMICALENISRNTCEILTQVTIQTQLHERMHGDLELLRCIAEFAKPDAAFNCQRHSELEAKIEKCCPPDKPKPACNYRPCDRPKPVDMPRLPKLENPNREPTG